MTHNKKRVQLGGVIAILIAKSAKLLKLLKLTKPLITFATMTLSMFAYSFMLGPWFAIGLVLMLFIHEMGHVIALRIKGYEASSPVFIPFLGAAIFAPAFRDRENEAFVGYGGPLLGSLAAVALFGIWFLLPPDTVSAHLVLMTSYAAGYINAFNLIPISPLDGGRITQAVGNGFKYIGLLSLVGYTTLLMEPGLMLIWILVLSDLDILALKTRAITCTVCQASMIILMVLGYGHQGWCVNTLDIIAASMFTSVMIYKVRREPEITEPEALPELPFSRRALWLGLWLGLTVSLVLLMTYQTTLLPEPPTK